MIIRVRLYGAMAVGFATVLTPAIGSEGKRGAKTIELSGDYTMPIAIKGKTAHSNVAADALKWPIFDGGLASALDLKSGPDEIVMTADLMHKPHYAITLGRDCLKTCLSVT